MSEAATWESSHRRSKVRDLLCGAGLIAVMLVLLGVYLSLMHPSRDRSRAVNVASTVSSGEGADSQFRHLGVIGKSEGEVSAFAISQHGRFVASAGFDRTLRLWNIHTAKPEAALDGHSAYITSAAFSPDDTHMVSGDEKGQVRIWDLEQSRLQHVCEGHHGAVRGVAYYPLGTFILSGGEDRQLRVWNAQEGKLAESYQKTLAPIERVAMSLDGRRLAAGCSDGSVAVWDACRPTAPMRTFAATKEPVLFLALAADGRDVQSIGADGVWRSWDVDRGVPIQALALGETDKLKAAARSIGQTRVVTVDSQRVMRVIDQGRERVASLEIPDVDLARLALTPDSRFAMSAEKKGEVSAWNLPWPTKAEMEAAQQIPARLRQRAASLEQYAAHMQTVAEAEKKQDIKALTSALESAKGSVSPETFEFHLADRGYDKAAGASASRDRYVTLMQEGQALIKKGDHAGAKRKFELARGIAPDRPEAKKGVEQAEHAIATKALLESAKVAPRFEFEFQPRSTDLLQAGSHFAWLYNRESLAKLQQRNLTSLFLFGRPESNEAPVGDRNSPLTWNVLMTLNKPLEMSNLAIRLRLIRAKDNQQIAEIDHPLPVGTTTFNLIGRANAPQEGWLASDYHFRKFLVVRLDSEQAKEFGTQELLYEHQNPVAFSIGMIHWEKSEQDLEPSVVHATEGHSVPAGLTLRPGEAYRLDADGQIRPASPAFLTKFFRARFNEAVPIKPEGLRHNGAGLAFAKLGVDELPFGCLLCRFDTNSIQPWRMYLKETERGVAMTPLNPHLSINSVYFERKGLRAPLQQVPKRDGEHWRANAGAFHITLYRGQFEAVDPLSFEVKLMLAKRFWN